jgi:pimeloyl-ACP methyl ester carboxylesterase
MTVPPARQRVPAAQRRSGRGRGPLRSRILREPRRPRAAAEARRVPDRWVEADDGARLAVWVHEAAAPPAVTVVLVHGWTLAAAVWDRALAALCADRPDVRVVRYDQRGHGSSSARGRAPASGAVPASIGRLADDLAQVVDALAPTGPLVLVGHSMGGMALLAATGRHPGLLADRTQGLVLCSTSAGGLSSAGRPLVPLMAALARLPDGVLVPRVPRVLNQRANYGRGVDPELVAAVSDALGRPSGRSTGEWFAALMAHDETAALPAVAAAGTPVRIIVGDADRLTPVPHARALAAALPQAALQVVPDAGHMLLVERPDVVADAVASLLGPAPAGPPDRPLDPSAGRR